MPSTSEVTSNGKVCSTLLSLAEDLSLDDSHWQDPTLIVLNTGTDRSTLVDLRCCNLHTK